MNNISVIGSNDGPAVDTRELGEWVDGVLTTKGIAPLPDRLSTTTLNATYVRFVDLAGNPISARHVTIKVDTSTWEIADIVAEA